MSTDPERPLEAMKFTLTLLLVLKSPACFRLDRLHAREATRATVETFSPEAAKLIDFVARQGRLPLPVWDQVAKFTQIPILKLREALLPCPDAPRVPLRPAEDRSETAGSARTAPLFRNNGPGAVPCPR